MGKADSFRYGVDHHQPCFLWLTHDKDIGTTALNVIVHDSDRIGRIGSNYDLRI